ncbi:glycogen synthase [Tepidiforma thermophila]|uniref:Glycogen synthase n=1 Tax=Tepidiforma thermophila (strain KCTC 52669 / CGMCC 1.13589 / G233) TaxID=2761530 RepID=A0A2A9HJN0_TEPT2|nr:glycogen synthase [Tepidiforma thermophila]PFG75069.1 glycogen synthase (ADP-glucose) [Tepidiforma thermophila]
MRILFASAEVDPFAKVGGLADVAASLPQRLKEIGHDVRVVTPCHASGKAAHAASRQHRLLTVQSPGKPRDVDIATVEGIGGVPVELVADEHYFLRPNVYGEPDDLLRYQFFCRVIIEMLRADEWVPDILHLNDWHTAPLAFGLRNQAWSNPRLRGVASVFTIHNLRYRGPDELNDFLAQAIYYADVVTTVSPTYAREILTREYGEGLEALLGLRGNALLGILNGLNYDLFNPRTDPHVRHHYDLATVEQRWPNRDALREELGLPKTDGPIAAMVTRLTEQKGVDLAIQIVPEMVLAGGQFVVLGDGDAWLKEELRRLAAEYPDHVRLAPRHDPGLAQRIYAGCDLFLMPSRYEPCGLGQLIAMRYGAVPVGRRTGGLADTILDLDEHPETGTGFLFDEFSQFALASAYERAVRAFREPETWLRLQRNGMSRDYSWRASATYYIEAYTQALRARGIVPLE